LNEHGNSHTTTVTKLFAKTMIWFCCVEQLVEQTLKVACKIGGCIIGRLW